MSTAGSGRSVGAPAAYTPGEPGTHPGIAQRATRTRLFRWKGIIPTLVGVALFLALWAAFGEPIIADTVEEAASKALGTQVDVAGVEIDETRSTLTLRGITIADPFDSTRNLVQAGQLRIELALEPLLEKKVIIERLALRDVRTGTARATPARSMSESGFAPRALREMQRFRSQFRVPLLSLTPIDTIQSIVLDPTQLATVRAVETLVMRADSTRGALRGGYQALRIEEMLDSARALVARLQATNPRALGVAGVSAAVSDVQRTAARLDSARRRIEALARDGRTAVDLLERDLRSLDESRRQDYAFARGLLKLPTFDAPDIGAGLFGAVTIDKFQQALYWAMLAREHAPPGLRPRQRSGPSRLRRAGTTVHFVEREALPRFLIRRADVELTVGEGGARGIYGLALADVTTEPTIVGRPMAFALRRESGGDIETLAARGTLDHVRATPRDIFTVEAGGVRLPTFTLPVLPLRADLGRGTSELRVDLDGERVAARWTVRSTRVTWVRDSLSRQLNPLESLVARVIMGLGELDLTAELTGELAAPRLTVRSNLDRAIAARVQAVAGEEIERAEAGVRAQVDRIVEEKTAPLRERVAELRSEAERRVSEASSRLDEERARLDAQLRSVTGGLIGLPKVGGH
jgi:uncharacterized protein (TIGR03545 family)